MTKKKTQYVLRSGDLKVETLDAIRCNERFIREDLEPRGLIFDSLDDALYASTVTRAVLLALASTRQFLSKNRLSHTPVSKNPLRRLLQKLHGRKKAPLGLLQRRIEENVLDRIRWGS